MKHFFVTGATGSIGSALIPVLLEQHKGDVQILVRAKNEDHLQERFTKLIKFWDMDPEFAKAHVAPYIGDMTKPNLGMDKQSYKNLINNCTHIIHCGGVVRMNLPLEEARKSAIGTAKEIVSLGLQLQRNGKLAKIDYLSTVGVIGKSSNLLKEELVTKAREFHNTYEQSKAEAEEYLQQEIKNHGLPITIHRPSMVVGDSRTGKAISFQVFYHLCEFLSGKRTFGVLPKITGAKLDVIPVDYVAHVISWAAAEPKTIGAFIHECSGPEHAVKISDMEKVLLQIPHFQRQGKSGIKQNIHLPLPVFNFIIWGCSVFFPERERKVLRTLPFFLNYLDDQQNFGDDNTALRLGEAGITKPHPDDYLPKIIEFYVD